MNTLDDSSTQAGDQRARLTLAMQQAPASVIVNLVLAGGIALFLSGRVALVPLVVWTTSIAFAGLLRVVSAREYLAGADRQRDTAGLKRLYMLSTLANAALWGLASASVVNKVGGEMLFVAGFAIGALMVGAIVTLSALFPLFVGFAALTMLPFAAALLSSGEQPHFALGLILLLFGVGAVIAARHHARTITQNLTLARSNGRLVRELSDAKAALESELRRVEAAQRALLASERRIRDFADISADWFWETNESHRVTYVSDRLLETAGLQPESILGTPHPVLVSDDTDSVVLRNLQADLDAQRPFRDFRYYIDVGTDAPRYVSMSGKPRYDAGGCFVGYRGTGTDITRAQELSEELRWHASHDTLTGLVNRREFDVRLSRALETANNAGAEHVLCYLDLDQFKVINDTCGHVAGDALLRQLADTLQGLIRHRDTLARLGGDEFGLLMEHCSMAAANDIVRSLRDAVRQYRFGWNGRSFSVGVSIGVVRIVEGCGSTADVLAAADVACITAKDCGRNGISVYDRGSADVKRRRGEMQWVHRVSQALDDSRFQLCYQPIVPCDPRRQIGYHYELLVRMLDEDGNAISPATFLPAVERYGLSVDVDRWVIRRALDWLRARPEHVASLEICAINLSGPSLLDANLLADICTQLDLIPGIANKLCFEITETAAIANLSSARKFMEQLKDRGCAFALDDFGSGLSSFGYLRSLPVDYLKIDGQFVQGMIANPIDAALVKSINEIGHVMGKRTIAEFVEDAPTLAALRAMGVDYAQGHGIGVPRPLSDWSEDPAVVNANAE